MPSSPLRNVLVGAGKIPRWIKILHTLFVVVLVPVYWIEYGPVNFLWFSDIALFVALLALWTENSLLASTQAVSVAAIEIFWNVEFLIQLVFGTQLVGLTNYMFDEKIPLFVRGLSLFHVWLPVLLLWTVYRLGYDRRAWRVQCLIACFVLLVCFFATDPQKNINWVFGPGEKPQSQIAPGLYFGLTMLVFLFGVYLPTHWVLRKVTAKSPSQSGHHAPP